MSDLDDEELEATRRINGVAKEINIEKDIKRCEELIKPEHANWIGISNQLAIAHVVDKVKELEAKQKAMCEEYCPKTEKIKELEAKLEFKSWGDLDNIQFEEYMNQFIQKVKDKIEELKKEYEIALEENSTKAFILKCKISALEELLEDK